MSEEINRINNICPICGSVLKSLVDDITLIYSCDFCGMYESYAILDTEAIKIDGITYTINSKNKSDKRLNYAINKEIDGAKNRFLDLCEKTN